MNTNATNRTIYFDNNATTQVAPDQVRAWRACADMACVCGARCACADVARCVVGADVPAARVHVGVPDVVP